MNKLLIVAVAAFVTPFVFADEAEDTASSPWTFSVGPSWRSRVKMTTRGTIAAPAVTPRSTTKRDMTDQANWTDVSLVDDPQAGQGGVPAGSKIYGTTDTRTEVYGTAGSDYTVSQTDEDRPIGVTVRLGYNFLEGDTWAIDLGLRFAGYWNMKSATGGRYNAGCTQTDVWTDSYIFPKEDPDSAFSPTKYTKIAENGSTLDSSVRDYGDSRYVATRFRGDLYQIGLGPKVTWSPFAEWCPALDWLDVYGGVEVLCNIAYEKLRADGASTSSTDCLIGFGGNVGLVGNITDWCGIYGQVGYEWINDTDVSVGAYRSDIDYSSLVLSAGVLFRF